MLFHADDTILYYKDDTFLHKDETFLHKDDICELNISISCTSTTVESRAKIWYQ